MYETQFNRILARAQAADSKSLLTVLANNISKDIGYSSDLILDKLRHSFTEGNASVSGGVCVLDFKIKGLKEKFITLMTLRRPITDTDTADNVPVDIVCVVISPETENMAAHLHTLSRVSRVFTNADFCDKLRTSKTEDAVRSLIMDPEGWLLAA